MHLQPLYRNNKNLNYLAQVDEFDVDKAIWLMRVSTQKSATDPRTGQIDMDALSTGTTVNTGGGRFTALVITLCCRLPAELVRMIFCAMFVRFCRLKRVPMYR